MFYGVCFLAQSLKHCGVSWHMAQIFLRTRVLKNSFPRVTELAFLSCTCPFSPGLDSDVYRIAW